ncbi:MAG: hypothetical protein EA419_00500 [Wenzhouxiangella sp.]|nr:MAG: hypothetical protein EA419_00500 [Wenzhouxiangella sp.]
MTVQGAPVLVQRGLLLDGQRLPDGDRIGELVAFQRVGKRVLVLARQPARWRPTRNSMDEDLGLQQALHQAVVRAGAELDGTLYVSVGLFARRQARLNELVELAGRYRVEPAELTVVGSDSTLLESVIQCGGRALAVAEHKPAGASRYPSLQSALAALA